MRRRHLSQGGYSWIFSTKTQSSGGFQSSQMALWIWPENIGIEIQKKKKKKKKEKKKKKKELLEATSLKSQSLLLLAELCPPNMWHKIADTQEQLKSLCVKPTTQRATKELKHKAPSVRALKKCMENLPFWVSSIWSKWLPTSITFGLSSLPRIDLMNGSQYCVADLTFNKKKKS